MDRSVEGEDERVKPVEVGRDFEREMRDSAVERRREERVGIACSVIVSVVDKEEGAGDSSVVEEEDAIGCSLRDMFGAVPCRVSRW